MNAYAVSGGTITEAEIEEWKRKIDNMTHFEMAYMWKTAPCFPVFHCQLPLFEHFDKRFRKFGGLTDEISAMVKAEIERLGETEHD